MSFAIGYHFFGAANFISQIAHGLDAFRVGHHWCVGVFQAATLDRFTSEENMGITTAWPKPHFPSCLPHHPLTEVLIRHKKNFTFLRYLVDDIDRIATGADYIAQPLNSSRAINIGDHIKVWVFLTVL